MIEYNQEAANKIERSYITPEMAHQRARTLEELALKPGEHVLDVGCGTGLLTQVLGITVGQNGRVVGYDSSQEMLDLATQRCKGLPQIQLKKGTVENLPEKESSFDVVTSTQVLLYVPEVSRALEEWHRMLKSGGRIAIVETDWRGVILNSSDDALCRRMFAAWDAAVPSPNLPVQLGQLLRAQGFTAIRVEPIPILNTSYRLDSFSTDLFEWVAHYAKKQGVVTEKEATKWLEDFARLGEKDEFFFCVNRFLFTAVKP